MRLRRGLGHLSMPLSMLRTFRGHFWNNGFLRLIYHDVPPAFFDAFKQQMEFALKYYTFVSPELFIRMREQSMPIIGGNLLLTFDDGFKSNRYIAEKILGPLGIKALFFVATDFVACMNRQAEKNFIADNLFDGKISADDIPDHLQSMEWSDLHYLLERGHTIGSHTKTHVKLSMVNESEILEREIVESGDILQNRLGAPIVTFAYPFGDIDSINSEALLVAGNRYQFVFSGIRGRNHPEVCSRALRRDAVSLNDPLPYFQFILEGGLSPWYCKNQKKLDKMISGL